MAVSRRKKCPAGEPPGGADRPVVTLDRDGQTVFLMDPPRVAALDALVTVRHGLVSRGGRGPALVPSPEPLGRQSHEWSRFHFGAGLAPAADALLVAAGYAVHYAVVTSPRPVPLADPDYLVLKQA